MTNDSASNVIEPTVLNRDEGAHHHFLNHLATTKVRSEWTGSMGAVEFRSPRGFGPPVHVHDDEDELIVVLDGEIAFRSGGTETVGRSGSCAFLPSGIPHGFEVLSDEARFLAVTASAGSTPRFDRFVAAVGQPTETAVLPEPGPVDPEELERLSNAHGITIVGPPPGVAA